MARNRVIYQSEALFVSEDVNSIVGSDHNELIRIQGANYGFTINRTDVNQFGKLARIDSLVLEPPTVNFDFSYYLGNGQNENNLGFSTLPDAQFVSGFLAASSGRNFYIVTSEEGQDATTFDNGDPYSLIGIGNAFLTDYNIDMSVGSLPRAAVTFEASNINSQNGVIDSSTFTGNLPSIKPSDGTILNGVATLNKPKNTGQDGPTAIRPGDIVLDFPGFDGGESESGTLSSIKGAGGFHIQSSSISIPLSRSAISRLGSKFPYARVVDFPVNATMSVNGILNTMEAGNLAKIIAGCGGIESTKDVSVTLKSCEGEPTMKWTLKGATLNSENWSSSVGSNKAVDLTFGVQIGGIDDIDQGIIFSGSYDVGNRAPSIAFIPTQNKNNEDVISLQVQASDPNGDTLTYSAIGLPAGLSINPSNGLIDGTIASNADLSSPYSTTIQVVDDGIPQLTGTANFTWNVFEINTAAPAITPIGNQTNDESDVISLQVFASDADTLTYSAVGLPGGLSINTSNGLINGTIANDAFDSSPYTTIITVTDDGFPPLQSTEQFTWTVNEVIINQAPVFNNIPNTGDPEGTLINPYDIAQYASDPNGDTLTYTASGLPTGLLMESTGRITGTIDLGTVPDSPYNVTVYAVDDGIPPLTGSTGFNWTVTPLAQPLTIIYDDLDAQVTGFAGDIPDSYWDIEGAPADWQRLEIGPSVVDIGDSAFYKVNSVGVLSGALTIPANVRNIKDKAFQNTTIQSLTIESGVTGIGDFAFNQLNAIQPSMTGNLTIPGSVDVIGQYAFSATEIESANINARVISNNVFASIPELETVTLGPNVERIGAYCFDAENNVNNNISTLTNNSTNLKYIGDGAFRYHDFSGFNFNEGLTGIGIQTFEDCFNLTGIDLPDSLLELSTQAFRIGKFDPNLLEKISFGTGLKVIPNSCFQYRLKDFPGDIVIPDNIEYIGNEAFLCDTTPSFTGNLVFGTGVTGIGSYAFARFAGGPLGPTGLQLPPNIKSIGSFAFNLWNGHEELTIPSGVESIGSLAFVSNTSLTGITINCPTGSWVGTNSFNNTPAATYYVTGAYYLDYIDGDTWSGAQGLAAGSEIICYGDGCPVAGTQTIAYFDEAKTLEASGIYGDIPDDWMLNSGSISGVTFGSSATKIGFKSFYKNGFVYDPSYTIDIPDNIKEIGASAFNGAGVPPYFSANVNFGTGVTGIKGGVLSDGGAFGRQFFGGSNELILPPNIIEIGANTFNYWSQYTELILPESLETIGFRSFVGCTGLSGTTIPSNVTSIGGECFKQGLKAQPVSMVINCPVSSWVGVNAFEDCVSGTFTITGAYYQDYTGSNWSVDQLVPIGSKIICYGDGCPVAGTQTIAYDADNIQISGINGDVPDSWNLEFAEDIHYVTIGTSTEVIGDSGFRNEPTLSGQLTIPATVRNIKDYAFEQPRFTGIVIEEGITGIGQYAFNRNAAPYTISGDLSIPDSVIDLGSNSFYGLEEVDNVYVGARNIGPNSLAYGKFTGVTLGTGVETIGSSAFYAGNAINSFITSVNNTSTVLKDIRNSAFRFQKFTGFNFNEGITGIGTYAFDYCDLRNVTIPDSVTSIGSNAFSFNTNLKSIEIRNASAFLSNSSFFAATNATGLVLGPNIQSIEAGSFQAFGSNEPGYTVEINCPTGVWSVGGFGSLSYNTGFFVITGAYFQDYTGSSWSGDQNIGAGSKFISGTY